MFKNLPVVELVYFMCHVEGRKITCGKLDVKNYEEEPSVFLYPKFSGFISDETYHEHWLKKRKMQQTSESCRIISSWELHKDVLSGTNDERVGQFSFEIVLNSNLATRLLYNMKRIKELLVEDLNSIDLKNEVSFLKRINSNPGAWAL